GEREELAELGVATYVAPPACQDPAYQPSPLGFDDIFDYIHEVGMLLGVEQQAQTLVAQQQDRLEAITPDERGLTAVWYSSGSDIPFVGGGIGAPQLLMETVGLTNINADIDDTWASVAWEAIADQNPDVIVLVDSAWNTVDNKIGVLESNPITARMDAVKNERYLTVDFPASEAGVRSVDAAASLASQLAELD
ncbi:MAG TPA: ABC transporter substrate-binding protein, partial [Beutenbergiaceae bacterium]|nr:ABC transporter substrate-binding protein [Beutenbergiaceae bacterium]